MTISDLVQILGAGFILGGYWTMASSVKLSSLLLLTGCIVWAFWTLLITPMPIYLCALELVLGAMSARSYWRNRHASNEAK